MILYLEGFRRTYNLPWGWKNIPDIFTKFLEKVLKFHLQVLKSSILKNQWHYSLSQFHTQILNVLPRNIKGFNGGVDLFKNLLNEYLQTVEDEPGVTDYNLMLPETQIASSTKFSTKISLINLFTTKCLLRRGPPSGLDNSEE